MVSLQLLPVNLLSYKSTAHQSQLQPPMLAYSPPFGCCVFLHALRWCYKRGLHPILVLLRNLVTPQPSHQFWRSPPNECSALNPTHSYLPGNPAAVVPNPFLLSPAPGLQEFFPPFMGSTPYLPCYLFRDASGLSLGCITLLILLSN